MQITPVPFGSAKWDALFSFADLNITCHSTFHQFLLVLSFIFPFKLTRNSWLIKCLNGRKLHALNCILTEGFGFFTLGWFMNMFFPISVNLHKCKSKWRSPRSPVETFEFDLTLIKHQWCKSSSKFYIETNQLALCFWSDKYRFKIQKQQ